MCHNNPSMELPLSYIGPVEGDEVADVMCDQYAPSRSVYCKSPASDQPC